jgi:ESCRT-I complex subunit TSG101
MVHDPRVTTLISRLGGLYRDPARVDRDASSLLKSSVGAHLTPGIAPLVENNGDCSHCLVLQGTIAICFRGMTYQLLVDVYLPPGYPIRPPVSFVRLAPSMYLKENHPHVGSDGMVYMPYTAEWNPRTHSLIEMVVAMSSVFSADPPVFTRTVTAPEPPLTPYVSAAASATTTSGTTSSSSSSSHPPPPTYSDAGFVSSSTSGATNANINANSSTKDSSESERYLQEQIAIIVAREAEEANAAAEVARRAEEEREKQIASQKEWEEKKKIQIKEQVNRKILLHLVTVAEQTKENVQSDWRDQQQLKQSKETIAEELEHLQETKAELEKHIAVVDTKTTEIEEWLEESKGAKQEEMNVDDICQPVSKLHAQMLDLSAENATLTDALYFLDRGMYMGQIDCSTHLKSVRTLAKRQFLVRAYLIKIDQTLLKNGHR